jgi:hypothetical protein
MNDSVVVKRGCSTLLRALDIIEESKGCDSILRDGSSMTRPPSTDDVAIVATYLPDVEHCIRQDGGAVGREDPAREGHQSLVGAWSAHDSLISEWSPWEVIRTFLVHVNDASGLRSRDCG